MSSCLIILFLLLCGNTNNNSCKKNTNCGGLGINLNNDSCEVKKDCDSFEKHDHCDKEPSNKMMPPAWTRSRYTNGDTCGCEEK